MEDGSSLHRNRCRLYSRLEPIMAKSALTPIYPAKASYFNQYPEQNTHTNGAKIDGNEVMHVPG